MSAILHCSMQDVKLNPCRSGYPMGWTLMATSARHRSGPKHPETPSPSKAIKPHHRTTAERRASPAAERQALVDLPPAARASHPAPDESAERLLVSVAREITVDTAFDRARLGTAAANPANLPTPAGDLSTAAVAHLARYGYATAGRALRITSRNVSVAAQAMELAGLYATSASLMNQFAAQAFSCSRELARLTLESQTELAQFIGTVAVDAATTPFRIAASRLA
jgi:hypothetical protein